MLDEALLTFISIVDHLALLLVFPDPENSPPS